MVLGFFLSNMQNQTSRIFLITWALKVEVPPKPPSRRDVRSKMYPFLMQWMHYDTSMSRRWAIFSRWWPSNTRNSATVIYRKVDEFKGIVMKDQGPAADDGKSKGGIMELSFNFEILLVEWKLCRRNAKNPVRATRGIVSSSIVVICGIVFSALSTLRVIMQHHSETRSKASWLLEGVWPKTWWQN